MPDAGGGDDISHVEELCAGVTTVGGDVTRDRDVTSVTLLTDRDIIGSDSRSAIKHCDRTSAFIATSSLSFADKLAAVDSIDLAVAFTQSLMFTDSSTPEPSGKFRIDISASEFFLIELLLAKIPVFSDTTRRASRVPMPVTSLVGDVFESPDSGAAKISSDDLTVVPLYPARLYGGVACNAAAVTIYTMNYQIHYQTI